MRNEAVEAAGKRLERFAAPPGRWLGIVVMAVGALAGVSLAIRHPVEERGFALLCLGVVLIAWVVMVRPSVAVHSHGVLLTNMLHDVFVPFSKIERCRSVQTLQIVTAGERFHGLGVVRSARSMVKESRGRTSLIGGMSLFGGQARLDQPTSQHRFANEEQTGASYESYVESKVMQLASGARPDELEPVVVWAWPAVLATAVALVFVVLLFV